MTATTIGTLWASDEHEARFVLDDKDPDGRYDLFLDETQLSRPGGLLPFVVIRHDDDPPAASSATFSRVELAAGAVLAALVATTLYVLVDMALWIGPR